MAHIHAELMKQYAEDAANYDEPWKFLEVYDITKEIWETCNSNPSWFIDVEYRRKLTKLNPLKETPNNGEYYYVPYMDQEPTRYCWSGDKFDRRMFDERRVFKTKKDALSCEKWLLEKLKESVNDNS